MRIISKKKIKEFWIKYPDSERPLKVWYSICKNLTFKNFSEIKNIFNSSDFFEDKIIFDIGGNKYRLIVKIQYKIRTIFIKGIYTHKEYEKGKWKK